MVLYVKDVISDGMSGGGMSRFSLDVPNAMSDVFKHNSAA